MDSDRQADAGLEAGATRPLTNAQRRRWRRLAVEFERLAMLHHDLAVELDSTGVTLRLPSRAPDRHVLDSAEAMAAGVPETIVRRSGSALRVDVG